MTLLVLLAGGAGLALVVTGLPPFRRPSLAERISPYLPGALLRTPPTGPLRRLAALLPGREEELARRLDAAGLHPSPLGFRTEQVAWAFLSMAICGAVTIAAAAAGASIDPAAAPLLAILCGISGFAARDWWLGKQIAMRREELKEELPTAMDLMTLSLIAGESPSAAMVRVAQLMRGTIGRVFERITGDVRAGGPFVEALERAKERTADPGMARFLDAMVTGIEKGTPLAEVLRAQADEARQARGRELLESAGRKEVLMLVPVVFLIMPVVVVYALFPGLVSLDLFVR